MNLERIAKLLAIGIPATQVANAVGITDGRLSQLVSESTELQSLITANKAIIATQEVNKVATLEGIERDLIDKIGGLVGELDSLGEGVRALEGIMKIKASKSASPETSRPGQATILINNLVHSRLELVLSSSNEIASIEGRSMTTMPKKQVLELVKERSESETF